MIVLASVGCLSTAWYVSLTGNFRRSLSLPGPTFDGTISNEGFFAFKSLMTQNEICSN